jgi:hypothetical protein
VCSFLPPLSWCPKICCLEAFSVLSFDSCFCFLFFCSDFTVSVFRCATTWFFFTRAQIWISPVTGQGSCFLLLYSCVSFNFYSAVRLGVGLHVSIFASGLRPGFFSAVFSSRPNLDRYFSVLLGECVRSLFLLFHVRSGAPDGLYRFCSR